ncbi:MAG: c-type cytochrome [Acidobacteria bacterium]|nr:c-type cytochrome [Acidobacteriota bacterium]
MAKKEEEKSYAIHFLVASFLLVLFSIWAGWWEAVRLRPWKAYQAQYYKLEQAKLTEELQKTQIQKVQIEKRYQEVTRLLEQASQQLQGSDSIRLVASNTSTAARAELMRAVSRLTSEQAKLVTELEQLTTKVGELQRKLAESQRADISIQQIYVPEMGRADRCTSCHVGIDKPLNVSHQQPYAPHPGMFIFLDRHPPSRFGCTVCHQGQGRATSSVEKGHGRVEYWLEPMLDRTHVSATCLKCHEDSSNLRGATNLPKGLELLKKHACYGCHKIAGYETLPKPGPPLTKIGEKVNYSWLVRWIKDPRSVLPDARMPNFELSDEEAQAVADFLFSFTRRERMDFKAPEVDEPSYERGKAIYNRSRCNICHPASEKPAEFKEVYGTDLSLEGSKIQAMDWIIQRIRDPRKIYPESVMPRYRFTDEELKLLASYIMGEFVDFEFEEAKLSAPVPIQPSSANRGREIVRKYGCFNCHEIQGFEREGKIGAELTSFGSKPLEQFEFGRVNVKRTRTDWIMTKLRNPRIFGGDLRMPSYKLADDEMDALTTLLLGLTGETMPAEFKVPKRPSDFALAGEAGKIMNDVKCLTCHSIRGRGGKFAPDLSFEGSAVEKDWLKSFLKSPDIIRPLLKQMPKFNLTDEEAAILADYIKHALVDDRISEDPWQGRVPSSNDVARGQRIYQAKGCVACHQIGTEGGAVGPNLTNVSERLTSGYLLARMKEPRAFRPEIIEPKYKLTEEELFAVTSFLKGLNETARLGAKNR